MADPEERRRVVLACQGGGSHTAFTAGVLTRLFRAPELGESGRYQVVGLSGTSGGAVCALLAWSALVQGDPGRAGELLGRFWADNSASAPLDRLLNSWTLWASKLQNVIATPAVSPYDTPLSVAGSNSFRRLLERRVDFDGIEVDRAAQRPVLVLGAVDVLSGQFRAFSSRRERISADMVLASVAIPNLFRAVRVDDGTYWDGLFSQNPPVRELMDEDPDELWVIQINPTRAQREPRTVVEIADRRNELAGNLSLYQELHAIEKIDSMLERGLLAPGGQYKQVVVRILELPRERLSRLSRSLGAASKLDRDPRFISELMAHGQERAEQFLTALAFEGAWRSRDPDAVLGFLAADAEAVSAAPFPGRGPCRGGRELRAFVRDHLEGDVRVDLTRKQIARDRVTWAVRTAVGHPGRQVQGVAEARFDAGRITSLRLGGD